MMCSSSIVAKIRTAGGSRLVVFGFALVLGVPSARAAFLDLQAHPPDMTSGFIDTKYEYSKSTGRGAFTAQGYALAFVTAPGQQPLFISDNTGTTFGSFGISMKMAVDANGQPVSGTTKGTVTIGGKIPSLGATSGTLLRGEISRFGFSTPSKSASGGGEIFEFAFRVTGGDLMSQYYTGESVIILDAVNSGFAGKFNTGFKNSGLGVSDTASPTVPPVPVPSSVTLLTSLVAVGLMRFGWRRLPCSS